LAQKYINDLGIDWPKVKRAAFNDRSNPDDDELGIQIVKDLHRTGCSAFSGQQPPRPISKIGPSGACHCHAHSHAQQADGQLCAKIERHCSHLTATMAAQWLTECKFC
jgi:hypothetical protein